MGKTYYEWLKIWFQYKSQQTPSLCIDFKFFRTNTGAERLTNNIALFSQLIWDTGSTFEMSKMLMYIRALELVNICQNQYMDEPKKIIDYQLEVIKFTTKILLKIGYSYVVFIEDLTMLTNYVNKDCYSKLVRSNTGLTKTIYSQMDYPNVGDSPEHKIILTPREKECLYWASFGKTSCETGQILGISRRTVEQHLKNCKEKFNSYTLPNLIYKAAKLNII